VNKEKGAEPGVVCGVVVVCVFVVAAAAVWVNLFLMEVETLETLVEDGLVPVARLGAVFLSMSDYDFREVGGDAAAAAADATPFVDAAADDDSSSAAAVDVGTCP